MKNQLSAIALVLMLLLMLSCKDKPKEEKPQEPEKIAEVVKLEKTFSDWWAYQYNNIDLSSDFTGLDEKGEEIGIENFLQKLNSGEYIPVKVNSDEADHYRLQQLGEAADQDIREEIKRVAAENLNNFRKIGTKFPDFEFQDLEGRRYSNEHIFLVMWPDSYAPWILSFFKDIE